MLGSAVAPLFQQLGIYDEFVAKGKHYTGMGMYTENLKLFHTLDNTPAVKEYVLDKERKFVHQDRTERQSKIPPCCH